MNGEYAFAFTKGFQEGVNAQDAVGDTYFKASVTVKVRCCQMWTWR